MLTKLGEFHYILFALLGARVSSRIKVDTSKVVTGSQGDVTSPSVHEESLWDNHYLASGLNAQRWFPASKLF